MLDVNDWASFLADSDAADKYAAEQRRKDKLAAICNKAKRKKHGKFIRIVRKAPANSL